MQCFNLYGRIDGLLLSFRQANPLHLVSMIVNHTACCSMAMFGRAHHKLEKPGGAGIRYNPACAPDCSFVQDGTRRDTNFREMQHEMYRNVLDQKQIAYTVLAGPLEQRLQHAVNLLQ